MCSIYRLHKFCFFLCSSIIFLPSGQEVSFTQLVFYYYSKHKQKNSSEVVTLVEKVKQANKDNKNFLEKEEWIKINYPDVVKEEEIVMNCALVPQDILERDDDVFCNEDFEYNTAKYIDMFNKRITPLLVCFKKEIRDKILITNPSDRRYFTEEESKLSSGEPNKPTDQDSYEKLMTMEDKEIKFWTKYNITPPFIEECGMGKWEDIVKDYEDRMTKEKELGIICSLSCFGKRITIFSPAATPTPSPHNAKPEPASKG